MYEVGWYLRNGKFYFVILGWFLMNIGSVEQWRGHLVSMIGYLEGLRIKVKIKERNESCVSCYISHKSLGLFAAFKIVCCDYVYLP